MVTPVTLSHETIITAVTQQDDILPRSGALQNFVAVNPYMGMLAETFTHTAHILAQRADIRMTAPRSFYAQAITSGAINDSDLTAALHAMPESGVQRIAELRQFASDSTPLPTPTQIPSVAQILGTVTHTAWDTLVTNAISGWAASYFDLGQASWKSPWQAYSAYTAWRIEARHDYTARIHGITHFAQSITALPTTAIDTITAAVHTLAIPERALEAYFP
jgi:uncharacterized protein YbcC (UPF0753/DUF2309 family)